MTAEDRLRERYAIQEKKWGEGTYTTGILTGLTSNSLEPEDIELIADLAVERLKDIAKGIVHRDKGG